MTTKRKVEITMHRGHTFLWIDDVMWMWDLPQEVTIQKQLAEQCYGDVLVAGYGLGVVQRALVENSTVKTVLTVEKEIEVYNACQKYYNKLYGQTVCMDFFLFSPSIAKVNHIDQYDCIIGDIWPEIHPDGLESYKKFKDKAFRLIKSGGKILGWGQEYYDYLLKCESIKHDIT